MSSFSDLLDKPLVVFDLETTGANPHLDRIVEFAGVKLFPDGSQESLRLLINPEVPIPPGATAIHGIRDEDVADKPAFAACAPRIREFIQDCDLGGFGVTRFDIPILKRQFGEVGIADVPAASRVVDALTIFHRREPRNLAAALAFYCGRDLPDAHSAEADAVAALEVIEGQLQKYADLPRDLDRLSDYCSRIGDDAIDPQGRLKWREDGEVIINFGQKTGRTLRDMAQNEPGYLKWILNKDFSTTVKDIARDALNGVFPTRD